MRGFTIAGYWGTAQLTAADMARFFGDLDRMLPRRHRVYGKGLLGSVVETQRWGIPAAAGDRWAVRFKGGWLPDHALAHQGGGAARTPRRPRARARDLHRSPALARVRDRDRSRGGQPSTRPPLVAPRTSPRAELSNRQDLGPAGVDRVKLGADRVEGLASVPIDNWNTPKPYVGGPNRAACFHLGDHPIGPSAAAVGVVEYG